MEELEKTAKALILDITERTLKSLKDKGLLKEPSKLQMLCFSPEMKSLIKKISTPKYSPFRLLKKGDRVQVKRRNGRCNGKDGEYLREAYCYVVEDEVPNELVRVYHNSSEYRLDPAYLDLVTPVEEEPYKIAFDDVTQNWNVIKDGFVLCSYRGTKHPHAEKSAEDERDRLNEEYRKEQR